MSDLVSVVMPIYNSAKYLSTAIESIRTQTHDQWELLCLDDGSTDESGFVGREYARRDSRIRYIPLPHRGIVPTMNYGVKIAAGDFIARMDADDVALAHRFATQIFCLYRNRDWAMVGAAYESMDEQGNALKIISPPCDPQHVQLELQKRNCLCHPAMMMRREALSQLQGPYRGAFRLAEDYDLWLRTIERMKIGNVSETLLRYRTYSGRSNPDRTKTEALSGMAARICAAKRRLNRNDPADDWIDIDELRLSQLGASKEEIHFHFCRALLAEARIAKKRGELEISRSLATAAQEYAPSQFALRQQLDYLWRRFRVFAA